jgi:hypothetical protein
MTPADLDPLDAAAAPLATEPAVGGRGRVATLMALGIPEPVARSMAARGASDDEVQAEVEFQTKQAAREAGQAKAEEALNQEVASYDPVGRKRLSSPLPQKAGRFSFQSRGDGTEAVVDNSPTEAESAADFAAWAAETPGSARQRRYDPVGADAWDAQVAQTISADAQNELAISASPFASQMRNDSEARQSQSNINTRQKIYDARANPLARNQMSDDEKARRDAVVRRAQARGNPLEYLGRDDINDWQREALSRGMLGTQMRHSDSRVEVALLEAQARSADRRADTESRASLASQERESRKELAEMESAAKAADRQATTEAAAQLSAQEREARSAEAALEREARAKEAQAAREEMQRQWAAKSEADRLQYEERRAGERENFERQMAGMKNDADLRAKEIEARLTQFGASNSLAQQKADEEARIRREQEKMAADKLRENEAVALAGPGGIDIVRGNLHTPAADQALQDVAASSDQSWTGYYNSDAVRLDAMLRRLGIEDQATRQGLVTKYGLGKPFAPGRSGPISAFFNWMSGPPQYPAPNKPQ